MKMPWTKRIGLAKAATILTTCLIVSTGLCGLNYAVVRSVSGISSWANAFLISAALAEALLIVLCIVGLFIVIIAAIVQSVRKHFFESKGKRTP